MQHFDLVINLSSRMSFFSLFALLIASVFLSLPEFRLRFFVFNFIFIGPCVITYDFLNVTNEMQLLETFIIIITALHVSGTSRPSSGAYENCTCNL